MIHLQSVHLRPIPQVAEFPFSLAVLKTFKELKFEKPITLLVGENGTGKSILLEALACAADMVVVGSESTRTDRSLTHARELGRYITLSWKKRPRRGFFLRAEDFFGYAWRLNQMRAEMESDLQEIDAEYKDRSDYARGLARMSTARELGAMRKRYGEDWRRVPMEKLSLPFFNRTLCLADSTCSTSPKPRSLRSVNSL